MLLSSGQPWLVDTPESWWQWAGDEYKIKNIQLQVQSVINWKKIHFYAFICIHLAGKAALIFCHLKPGGSEIEPEIRALGSICECVCVHLLQLLLEPGKGKLLVVSQTLWLRVPPPPPPPPSPPPLWASAHHQYAPGVGKSSSRSAEPGMRPRSCSSDPAVQGERERERVGGLFSEARPAFFHMKCPLVALKECLSAGKDKPPGEQIWRPAEQKLPCVVRSALRCVC